MKGEKGEEGEEGRMGRSRKGVNLTQIYRILGQRHGRGCTKGEREILNEGEQGRGKKGEVEGERRRYLI